MVGPNHNWNIAARIIIAIAMISAIGSAQTASAAGSSSAELFKSNCVVCHGENGAGSHLGKRLLTPDLRSKEIRQKSPSALAQTISAGKKNMPSFKGSLGSAEIQQLVEYVRQLHR